MMDGTNVGQKTSNDRRDTGLSLQEMRSYQPPVVVDDYHKILNTGGRRRLWSRQIHEQALQRPCGATLGRSRCRHPPPLRLKTPNTWNQLSKRLIVHPSYRRTESVGMAVRKGNMEVVNICPPHFSTGQNSGGNKGLHDQGGFYV